jgi:hypothetical protein
MFYKPASIFTLVLSILTYRATPAAAITTAIAPIAIDRHGWVITTDSAQPGNEAVNTLDDNVATVWHSAFNPDAPLPHWLKVDMGNVSSQGHVWRYSMH